MLGDAFRNLAGVEGTEEDHEGSIVGLAQIDGGLLIATSRGLYVVAPSSGEFEVFDTDFAVPIIDVIKQPRGLYVSQFLGGLVHYERQY